MSYHEDGEPDWDHIRDTKLFIDELRHEAIELTEAIEASGDAGPAAQPQQAPLDPGGPRVSIKDYPVWKCEACGHLVARDLIDPVAPSSCRHPSGKCRGAYVEETLYDDEDEDPWLPGEREFREVGAVHYHRMINDRKYAREYRERYMGQNNKWLISLRKRINDDQ